MLRIVLLLIVPLFIACDNQDSVFPIRMNSLLNDDSSKTWMVESETIDGEENAPDNINFRTVITFYDDFKFAEQPLNTLGNRPPKYGVYEVGNQNSMILFETDKKQNVFIVESYSKEKIVLKSEESSKEKVRLQLIPLPKL